MYLISIDYLEDAERKRLEYTLFQKGEYENIAERTKGLTVILKDDNKAKDLVKELIYKSSPDRIKVYEIKEQDLKKVSGPFERREEIKFKFSLTDNPFEDLSHAIDRILLQKNGVLRKTNEPKSGYVIKEFTTFTNKGKCDIVVRYKLSGEIVEIVVEMIGFIPAVDDMLGYINREVNHLSPTGVKN